MCVQHAVSESRKWEAGVLQGRVVLLRDRVKKGRVWGKGRGVAR